MALNANALIALAEIKTYLNIESSNTDADSKLELFINAASEKIEKICNRKLKSQQITEYHDGKNNDRILLVQYPASKPTSVYCDNGWQFTSDTAITDYDVEEENVLVLKSGYIFSKGNRNVKIIYTAGYSTIPSDLQLACMKLVDLYYSQQSDSREGVKGKSKNGENISFIDGVPLTIMELLDPYKRIEAPDSQAGYNY